MRLLARGAAVALGAFIAAAPAVAADADDALKQAAQHFADLEDEQARVLLEGLSAQGVAEADVLLGYLYADPLFAGRDYQKAVATFERAAAAGNVEAVFQLAESRFWPDYSDWTLSPDEKAARPTAEDAFGLLQRVAGEAQDRFKGHNAAKWRFAYLCTFGGYDCGEDATDDALEKGRWIGFDNLRAITGSFHILKALRSGELEKAGSMKVFDPYLSLGYADADPYVAEAATAFVWREVFSVADCPPVDGFIARGRFLAAQNGVAKSFKDRLDLEDCYNSDQMAALKEDVVASLDLLARAFGNSTSSWHLRRCYQEREAPSFGDCLLNAVRHHFFACTKLSLPAYYKRFEIEYRTSKRYVQCREMMLGYPPLHNRI